MTMKKVTTKRKQFSEEKHFIWKMA